MGAMHSHKIDQMYDTCRIWLFIYKYIKCHKSDHLLPLAECQYTHRLAPLITYHGGLYL